VVPGNVGLESEKTALLSLIQDWIADGSTIYSDCWASLDCLNDETFQRWAVEHSLHYKDSRTGVHTTTIGK
jgi:hypothetical protein